MNTGSKILISAILFAALASTGCNTGAPTGEIFDVVLARSVDSRGFAMRPVTNFSTGDTAIHVFFKIREPGSIESVRIVVSDAKMSPILQMDTTIDGRAIAFGVRMRSAGRPLPPGDYVCEIYLDPSSPVPVRQPDKVLKFNVGASGKPAISRATLARGFDTLGEAISPTTIFSTSDKECHVVLDLENVALGSTIGVVWRDVEGNELERDQLILAELANRMSFSVTAADGLPAGRYRCELYLVPAGADASARTDTVLDFRVGG